MNKKIFCVLSFLVCAFLVFASEPSKISSNKIKVVKVSLPSSVNSESTVVSNTEVQNVTSETNSDVVDVQKNEKQNIVSVVNNETISDVVIRKGDGTTGQTAEEIKQNRPVKLTWSIGVAFDVPTVNTFDDVTNRKKVMSVMPDVSLGMLIKDIAYLGFGVNPSFVSFKERVGSGDNQEIKDVPMYYEHTNLELNVGANFKLGDTDTLIAFAAGVDADSFKKFYIMPNIRIGISKLGIFEPVFKNFNIQVGGKYLISTKKWELKIGIAFSGIY